LLRTCGHDDDDDVWSATVLSVNVNVKWHMHSLTRKELRERYFGDYDALPLIFYNKVWPIDTVSDMMYDMMCMYEYDVLWCVVWYDVWYDDMMFDMMYDDDVW
jgi:hypothetical protein